MILYRPVGAIEMELIFDTGMKRFPPRLYWQPIFYPVLNKEYAIEIAEKWNTKDDGNGNVGFVTKFEIPDDYFKTFESHCVGMTHHVELWVPAEDLETFNDHIIGFIRVEKAFFDKDYVPSEKLSHFFI